MTDEQRKMARHALGLPNRHNVSYRNHYCIGPGGHGYAEWEDLVAKGLAVKRTSPIFGGDDIFHLTLSGALMARNSNEHLSQQDTAAMRQLRI